MVTGHMLMAIEKLNKEGMQVVPALTDPPVWIVDIPLEDFPLARRKIQEFGLRVSLGEGRVYKKAVGVFAPAGVDMNNRLVQQAWDNFIAACRPAGA